jgi:DNA-binding response OmpR family regulator
MHERRLDVGPIAIDRRTYSVCVGGRRVKLTPADFDLLTYLAENHDRVISASELAERVFSATAGDVALLVRVHICSLRRAMGTSAGGAVIKTLRGRGYRIVHHEERDAF